jgi:diguanylate cyclase (GGDEF)-like protein
MRHSQHVRRAAVVGLAITLLALTALSVVGTLSTRHSAERAVRFAVLAAAYDRAHDAVAAEESLERKYRLEPGADVRLQHRQAGGELNTALMDIRGRGGPADGRLVDTLQRLHDRYWVAVAHMFAAIDIGDEATTRRIDNEETDPVFGQISELVQTATTSTAPAAHRAVDDMHRIQAQVFVTTIVGFAVGLCLLTSLGVVAVGYRRALTNHGELSRHQATHDPLTGLPNRTLFTDRLAEILPLAKRHGDSVAVILLDLDRFKEVNDTLGLHYGDELLRQIGVRVRDELRVGDTVARLSSDEFAILLPGTDEAGAVAFAERIISSVHRSFPMDNLTVDVEVSVGVAVAPVHADSPEALLRFADVAMYAAKDTKTGLVVYRPEMHTQDSARLVLLGDLRRALDADDQLFLHYQPKVSLSFGEVRGVEALVRWNHPTRGLVSPADFIPIAETTGLINRLTSYVMRLAVRQARDWLQQGLPTPVAVNLSPRCLLDPTLVASVTRLLGQYQLPAGLLRLEVTETAVMANPAVAMTTLTALRNLGIRLSIDDFGTGYSSMAYLKRLPVDELKVDRSFVLNMTSDHNDAVLVRSAIDLGHNLGMTVVAEGVEGVDHVAALQDLGCDIAQGFHYARPMSPEDLTHWMHAYEVSRPETVATTDETAITA